jgi:hypothetical protein
VERVDIVDFAAGNADYNGMLPQGARTMEKKHELSKDGSAGIHDKLSPSAEMQKYDLSAENISNRKVAFENIISCFYKC